MALTTWSGSGIFLFMELYILDIRFIASEVISFSTPSLSFCNA